MADEIDKKLKESAQLALDVADENKSWIWKVIAGVLLAASMWYLKNELDKKARELADLKTKVELEKLVAQQALVTAQLKDFNEKTVTAEAAAQKKLEVVMRLETEVKAQQDAHLERVKNIDAIKTNDWDALNKLAGVKP